MAGQHPASQIMSGPPGIRKAGKTCACYLICP
jgi:hypothetical protein